MLPLLAMLGCSAPEANNPVLTIEGGQVQGVMADNPGVYVYRGIPYAAPPIGDLRWKEPQPVVAWEGIKIADKMFVEYGERFEWPDSNAEIKGTKFYCYGLKDQFGILSDGTVVPCCLDSNGTIRLGNIFTEDLSVILHSKRAQDLLEGFKCGKATEDLCQRCGYAQRFV
jgi:radical SAM protein with 4Fe4S-binding SPASM domain